MDKSIQGEGFRQVLELILKTRSYGSGFDKLKYASNVNVMPSLYNSI